MMRDWNRGKKIAVLGPIGLAGIAIFAFIGGESVKLLWNWLLPSIFGWREITFWQALGLLALTRILVGGFGMHGSGRSQMRYRIRERVVDRTADRVGDRWDAMTPEERERFRQRLRERLGFDPGGATKDL